MAIPTSNEVGLPVTVTVDSTALAEPVPQIISSQVGLPVLYVPSTEPAPLVAVWPDRPADWLAMPVLGPTEEKFAGLLAVTNDSSNYVALSATGDYTVDWGDGSAPEDVASGIVAEHFYTYAAVSDSTLSTRGYKQVLISLVPQSGQNLTSFSLQEKHSKIVTTTTSTNWLDFSLSAPLLSTSLAIAGATSKLALLENATIIAAGTLASFNSLFLSCGALHYATFINTPAVTDFTSMFSSCTALESLPVCDTSGGLNFSSMFANCTALATVPLLDTAQGQTFTNMFQNCKMLTTLPLLDTGKGTGFGTMFSGCWALLSIPALNTALGTAFANMFSACNSLGVGTLTGTTRAINYAATKLGQAELVAMFNALGTASGAQTLTISGCPGYADLTAADKLIASGKGWTIA